jgi:ABC-type sugar transport system ATPase subunit
MSIDASTADLLGRPGFLGSGRTEFILAIAGHFTRAKVAITEKIGNRIKQKAPRRTMRRGAFCL